MELTIAPKGILQIDNARIIYQNFSGAPNKFNREGDRNFAIVIDDEKIAQVLMEKGWNVKVNPPREVGDPPFMTLAVKVKFNDYGPNIYLRSGSSVNRLDEESVGILDKIDIENVDLDIRPYDWEVNGKEGRTAYLQGMEVVQRLNRFKERHAGSDM